MPVNLGSVSHKHSLDYDVPALGSWDDRRWNPPFQSNQAESCSGGQFGDGAPAFGSCRPSPRQMLYRAGNGCPLSSH
jgi:hypothetical protein